MIFSTLIPFAKINANNYLIGTVQRKIVIEKGKPLVKCSSKYFMLETFLMHEAKLEAIKIFNEMRKRQISFQDLIIDSTGVL